MVSKTGGRRFYPRPIEAVGESLSQLGKAVEPGLIAKAKEMGVTLPPELDDPGAELKPGSVVPRC